MTKKCYVQGCTSGVPQLFKFPQASTDKTRFLVWLAACGNSTLLDLTPTILRNRKVCAAHFEAKYIMAKKLSTAAVPTLHLPERMDVSAYKFCAEVENSSSNQCTNDENVECERQVPQNTPESSIADLPCTALNNNSISISASVKRKSRSDKDEPCAKRSMQAGATSEGKHDQKKNLCNGQYSSCPIIRLCFKAGIVKSMQRLISIKLKRHSSSEQAYELKKLQQFLNHVK